MYSSDDLEGWRSRGDKCEAPRPSREDGKGTPGPFGKAHGPEYVEWASRKVVFFYIVPLDPSYKAGLEGHVPAKRSGGMEWVLSRIEQK